MHLDAGKRRVGDMFPCLDKLTITECTFGLSAREFFGCFPRTLTRLTVNHVQHLDEVPPVFPYLTTLVLLRTNLSGPHPRAADWPHLREVTLDAADLLAAWAYQRPLEMLCCSGTLDTHQLLTQCLCELHLHELGFYLDLSVLRCPSLRTLCMRSVVLQDNRLGEWLHNYPELTVVNLVSVQDRQRSGIQLMTHPLPELTTLNVNDCMIRGTPGNLVDFTPALVRLCLMWCVFDKVFAEPKNHAQLQNLKMIKIVSAQTTPNLYNLLGPAVTHLDLGHMNTTDNLLSIQNLLELDNVNFIQIRKTNNQPPTTEAHLARAITKNTSLRCLLYRGAKQGETWLRVLRKRKKMEAVSFLRNQFNRSVLLAMLRALVQNNSTTRINLSTDRTIRMPDITPLLARNKLNHLSLRKWVFTRHNFQKLKCFTNSCYIKHLNIGEGQVYREITSNKQRITQAIINELVKFLNLKTISGLVWEYTCARV